ncbi:hypothetical protein ACLF3G_09175 [Falsiroseomonas sp. HC035]|uniref:hypothetical protein n=1 Tax=Falsiroseomonas sp. HC035 TaxID=3390999 RepID=UPI003D31F5DC
MSKGSVRLPPAVLVRSAAEGRAALEVAGPGGVLLLSAPGAAGFLGPGAWRALVAAAGATSGVQDRGDAPNALCCGDAAGDALAGLRAGCRILVLHGALPAFATVSGAAAEVGALLLPSRPPALDLRELDLRRPAARAKLADWLARTHDTGAMLR